MQTGSVVPIRGSEETPRDNSDEITADTLSDESAMFAMGTDMIE